ncbi:MAG: hypothetical protein JWL63_1569, partial [Rhodocyclales bacterium]|nr:hypothetical protein [Rhodocyclales bacterium]
MDITTIAEEILKALMPGHSDATRLIRLHAESMVDALLVERLEGIEQIAPASLDQSSPACTAGYRFDLSVLSTNAHLEAADWLGKPLLIELLTSQSRTSLRPLHGYITAFERITADGGFGYYRVTVEPWLTFLAHRRDSFVFHDMTIVEIVESLFADWTQKSAGAATLVPEWRWALTDTSLYPKRSITTQYDETDLAFMERLLAEEGLYYWFEHNSEGTLASAKHRLVIADDTAAFAENAQARIRFHRADNTETSDTIQQLSSSHALATHTVEIASWDYRGLDSRACSLQGNAPDIAAEMPLTRFDAPGAYLWPDRASGERYAARQIEAFEAQGQSLSGSGTVRTLAPGSTFALDNHFDGLAALDDVGGDGNDAANANRYAVLRVRHHARNNLNPALVQSVTRSIAHALTRGVTESRAQALPSLSSLASMQKSAGKDKDNDKSPLYTNDFTLLPATLPYRPVTQDAHGMALRPRPSAQGTQTAIVVGKPDAPVHTDRDGRIKLQFHWQRGTNSHSRLTHPAGDENAPADSGAWAWVRVMTPWAGNNWGSSFTPRVGQEVLVEFMEGDIDRPVVIGAVYNGEGTGGTQPSAQNNQNSAGAGAATGNAPSWFAGNDAGGAAAESGNTGPGHAHAATLAGIKTQAMTQSQQGPVGASAGYNQLAFDLTAGEPRAQLATTQFASALTLGANRHQSDNQRTAYRGHGAELVTLQAGALRAGSGLLLSSDGRQNASGTQLDSRVAPNQLEAAQSLVTTLADSAQKQKAEL